MIELLLVMLANIERTTPLVLDAELTHRAEQRAVELCEKKQWSHEGIEKVFEGYDQKLGGENLAKGSDDGWLIHDTWMESQLHRKNIQDERFSKIGVGRACGITVELFLGDIS